MILRARWRIEASDSLAACGGPLRILWRLCKKGSCGGAMGD